MLGLATSFCLGFAFKTIIVKQHNSNTTKMKKVTGVGGIFFKCKDPNKMREWYKTHLGFNTNDYGPLLSGGKVKIQQKRHLQHGVRLLKQQNILSLQQKTL